jgi:hypothetical protein
MIPMAFRVPRFSVGWMMVLVALAALFAFGGHSWRHRGFCLEQAARYAEAEQAKVAYTELLRSKIESIPIPTDDAARRRLEELRAWEDVFRAEISGFAAGRRHFERLAWRPWSSTQAGWLPPLPPRPFEFGRSSRR